LDDLRKLLFDGGRQVTVIEIAGRPAANVGISTRWPLLKNLKLMGVSIRTNTRIIDAREGWIDIETEKGMESIQADTIIVATGSVPVDDLLRIVLSTGTDLRVIGDAGGVGKISDAVREGFDLALTL
jgi:2,4-dienoyl-CoA reductase (NADPH2)